jgi:hypothetical protein
MRITPTSVVALLALAAAPSAALAYPAALVKDVDLQSHARPLEISASDATASTGPLPTAASLPLDASSAYISTAIAAQVEAPAAGGVPKGPGFPIFKRGFYAVGYVAAGSVDGDFDGSTVFTGVAPLDDSIFLDDIDFGVGFGVGIGYRFDDIGFEINWQRTYHDHSFGATDYGSGVEMNTLNFDFRYYFMTDTPLQPFVLLGAAYPWLDIDNGSVDTTTLEVGEANFSGLGFNFGGGVNFYITPQIAITGTAGWRYVFFNEAKGVNDPRGSLDPDVDGSGFFLYAGASFTF